MLRATHLSVGVAAALAVLRPGNLSLNAWRSQGSQQSVL